MMSMASSAETKPHAATDLKQGVKMSLAESIAHIMHKNMMVDPGDFNKKRGKKDVLWKPLLRGFRSYFRSQLNNRLNL